MAEEKTVSSDKHEAAVQPGVLREYSSASPEPKQVEPAVEPVQQ